MSITCFNTDDGIRRAAIYIVEGLSYEAAEGFNTDDGIRRAAMISRTNHSRKGGQVSIPMTVLGGLQFLLKRLCMERSKVSIPMTVLGGLQLHAVVMRPIRLGKFQYR